MLLSSRLTFSFMRQQSLRKESAYQFTNNSRIILNAEHVADDFLQIRLANHVGEFDFQIVSLKVFGDAREDGLVAGLRQRAFVVVVANPIDVVILNNF